MALPKRWSLWQRNQPERERPHTLPELFNHQTESTSRGEMICSKFHEGQKVRVVAGTKDPDYGFPIGGWSGSVEDIVLSDESDGSWLYEIHWNSNTLKAMGRALYTMCEIDNFEITRMVLAEHELEAE